MKRVLAALAFLAMAPSALASGDMDRLLCRSLLLEEERALSDLQLEVDLARSRESAAGKIFDLLERLRRNGHVERMSYLAGKHDRDIAALAVRRWEVKVQRQDALLQQYRAVCGAVDGGSSLSGERRAEGEVAARRYISLDCDIRILDVSIHEVDLAYQKELKDSVQELRRGEVATAQDVIVAERNLEMAGQRLEQARRRNATCQAELQAGEN